MHAKPSRWIIDNSDASMHTLASQGTRIDAYWIHDYFFLVPAVNLWGGCFLIQVNRVPLSSQRGMFKISREQERLHYQWFADMGYVDAQRAIGRLLSQGDVDEVQQALKYFRYSNVAHLRPYSVKNAK